MAEFLCLRKTKRKYYSNFPDEKAFWRTLKLFFSEKYMSNAKVTLKDGEVLVQKTKQLMV